MKEHLDKSKDEHLKMTASECKNLRAELVELKHIVAQVAPKPV